MVGAMSSNPKNCVPWSEGPHLLTSASLALRLHRRLHIDFELRPSLKRISCLGSRLPLLKDICRERVFELAGFNCFQWSFPALSAMLMNISFFSGDENRSGSKDVGKPFSRTSNSDLDRRKWTDVLLAANILLFMAQTVSEGKLLFWGAKINSLISKGQLWRLATSSFLHANIGHLMVNCYSLNSIGPTMENICGPKRYLTIYIASAIASSAMSYQFCKSPAVGASGAIFGLVGSFAVFILRHRGMFKGTEQDLKHIARVIALNMAIGILSQGIDNWGHVGGLIGGAAVSWFVGPAWEVESVSRNGRRILTDKAPVSSLFKRRSTD